MLEREVEKDPYRSYFHGNTNCSLKTNWYTGLSPAPTLVSKPSIRSTIKRKISVKMPISDEEDTSKRVATTTAESTEKHPRRRSIVLSDSEDENDGDFTISEATAPEGKKAKKVEGRPISQPPKSRPSDSRPIIRVKSSSIEDKQPTISVKFSLSTQEGNQRQEKSPTSPLPALPSSEVGGNSKANIPHVTFQPPIVHKDSHLSSEVDTNSLPVSSSSSSSFSSSSMERSDQSSLPSLSSTESAPLPAPPQPDPIISPCNIDDIKPHPRTQPVDDAIKKELVALITPLIQNPDFELFRDPVPSNCLEYYQLIDNPICLADIYKRIIHNRYKTIQTFRRDLFQVVSNCIYYNMLLSQEQSANRKQAYLLHREVIITLHRLVEEKCTADQLLALATIYHTLVESIYGVSVNDTQPIRYFAVDYKQLPEYTRYVKKPILLRTIIVSIG